MKTIATKFVKRKRTAVKQIYAAIETCVCLLVGGEELLRSLRPGPDRTTATEKKVRIGGPMGYTPDKDECGMQLETERKSPNDNDRIIE